MLWLSAEERLVLRKILETELSESASLIHHAGDSDVREEMREHRRRLEALLERFSEPAGQRPM